jgi:hypothetical protein
MIAWLLEDRLALALLVLIAAAILNATVEFWRLRRTINDMRRSSGVKWPQASPWRRWRCWLRLTHRWDYDVAQSRHRECATCTLHQRCNGLGEWETI